MQIAADSVGIGTPASALLTWSAIASTETVSARDNTSTDPTPAGDTGVPIYLLDGVTKIADHYDDLWDGSIDNALNRYEDGTVATGDINMWAGTMTDGTPHTTRFLGAGAGPVVGLRTATNSEWILKTDTAAGNPRPLYALSAELTVIPEPSTFLLAAFGLLGLLGWGRRRRR